MATRWGEPAVQHNPNLPGNQTLRAYAVQLRAQGYSWQQVADAIGGGVAPVAAKASVNRPFQLRPMATRKPAPRKDDKPTGLGTDDGKRDMKDAEWKSLAAYYKVTVPQLHAMRAAGLRVSEFKALQRSSRSRAWSRSRVEVG